MHVYRCCTHFVYTRCRHERTELVKSSRFSRLSIVTHWKQRCGFPRYSEAETGTHRAKQLRGDSTQRTIYSTILAVTSDFRVKFAQRADVVFKRCTASSAALQMPFPLIPGAEGVLLRALSPASLSALNATSQHLRQQVQEHTCTLQLKSSHDMTSPSCSSTDG